MTLRITYRVQDRRGLNHTDVPRTYTIGQLLQNVKTRHRQDYQYVMNFTSGAMINENELVIDLYTPTFVFYFTPTGEEPHQADFNNTEELTVEAPEPFSYPEINLDLDEDETANSIMITQAGYTIQYQLSPRPKLPDIGDDEFWLFSNKSYESMVTPIKVTMPLDSPYHDIEQRIKAALFVPEDKQVLIFLPNGCPFIPQIGRGKIENTLQLYFTANPTSNHHLYIVITRHIDDETLDMEIEQICDVTEDYMKCLYSPIAPAKNAEYTRIACLVGTFAYNGHQTGRLLNSLARVTGFAPLISSIASLQGNVPIIGRQLVAITAAFHTLCCFLLPIPQDDIRLVFENILECACYLVRIDEYCVKKNIVKIDNQFTIRPIEIVSSSKDPAVKYLFDSYLRNKFYPYDPNLNPGYCYQNITQPPPIHLIQYIFNAFASFRPVPPLTTRKINMTCIMQSANRHTILFLGESCVERTDNSIANIIDPLDGRISCINIENFALSLNKEVGNDISVLVEPKDIEEIVIILLDISGSMTKVIDSNRGAIIHQKLNRKVDPPQPLVADTSRLLISYQYILSFVQRTFGFRYPHLFALYTFNTEFKQICDLTPLPTPLEHILPIVLQNNTRIWNAIDFAIDQFNVLNPENEGRRTYKNALHRLLVFSDGIDKGSTVAPETICQKAIDSKVIVDSVVVSTFIHDNCDDLAKFCHLTGGSAFNPQTVEAGIDLFEMESFLSTRLRPSIAPSPDPITQEVFANAIKQYDTRIDNQEYVSKTVRVQLATPNYIMAKNKDEIDELIPQELRILREIKKFQTQADPEYFKLYLNENDIRDWKVYIMGPLNTPFYNHWWSLSVQFTDLYPLVPPLMRFISVPYHMNISEDGRICASFLFDRYSSNVSIIDLVTQVRNLLENPESEMVVSGHKLFESIFDDDKYADGQITSTEDAPTDVQDYLRIAPLKDNKEFEVSPNDFEEGVEEDATHMSNNMSLTDVPLLDPFSHLFFHPDEDDFM